MNHSSLFSFEESSVWDPKVIMKRLIVPEDQLIKLNSMPGWTKVQDNQNTLRLDKDFSIESSQSECSVIVTQNNQRIKKNTELFDEQSENRKSILETYKVYEKKLTRSLSFFTINKSCEIFFNTTIKRSLSLQSICQLSDASAVDEHFKNFICENSAKRHLPSDYSEPQKREEISLSKENNSKTMETVLQLPVVNISTPVESATLHSGSLKENNYVLSSENTETGVKQVICTADEPATDIESVNVLMHSETTKKNNGILDVDNADSFSETRKKNNGVLHSNKADSHSETAKDSNDVLADNADLHTVAINECNNVLPAKNASSDSNNIPDQLIKHDTESANANNVDLHSETAKENKSMLQVDNVDLHSETTKESNGAMPTVSTAKTVVNDSVNVNNSITSSVVKIAESYVPIVSSKIITTTTEYEAVVLDKSSFNMKKTIPSNYSTNISNTDVFKCYPEQDTEMSTSVECFVSEETIPPKNIALACIEKSNDMNLPKLCSSKSSAVDIPAEELFLSKKEAKTTPVENSNLDMENDKECGNKTCDPSKPSSIDETSVSKKRKLESRNKRSKKHRSEEKQGNLKIRSIKKVGEICYSAEEVKTMLDIMKQLL